MHSQQAYLPDPKRHPQARPPLVCLALHSISSSHTTTHHNISPSTGTTTTITAPTAPPSNPILSDSNGKPAEKLSDEEAKALLDEEEARRRARRRNKGRLQELQEIRAELAEREAELLEKEKELLEKEQTVAVLREEVRCRDVGGGVQRCGVSLTCMRNIATTSTVGNRKASEGIAVKGKGTCSRGGKPGNGVVWATGVVGCNE